MFIMVYITKSALQRQHALYAYTCKVSRYCASQKNNINKIQSSVHYEITMFPQSASLKQTVVVMRRALFQGPF